MLLLAFVMSSSAGPPLRIAPDHPCQTGTVATPPDLLGTWTVASLPGQPTDLAFWPGDADRALFTTRPGLIGWAELGNGTMGILADLGGRLDGQSWDAALNSVAFDPRWPDVPLLWVSWLDAHGVTVLANVVTEPGWPPRLRADDVQVWAALDAPGIVHPIGALRPHGDRLWVGVGDGVFFGEDGAERARLPDDPHAKILALDPAAPAPGNVRAGQPLPGAVPVAMGLRNPWRFDERDGVLMVADVGRDRWEEIDAVRLGCLALPDFGWGAFEGSRLRPGWRMPERLVLGPVAEWGHDPACAAIGGSIHGGRVAALRGAFVSTDFCDHRLRVTWWDGAAWQSRLHPEVRVEAQSINTGPDGETYILGIDGTVHRVVAAIP